MSKEGKKFYEKTEEGGMQFRTTRRIGDVRVPNYVYDMWMPLLGAVAIGVYATYCRLERKGTVKQITLQKLANACRISKHTLNAVNEKLAKCGFISIHKPEKIERLMHWTTKITVHEAPQDIAKEIIEELKPKRGYDLLSPWLEKDASAPPTVPPRTANTVPASTASIEALDVATLENCSGDEISEKETSPDEEFPSNSHFSSLGEKDPPKEEPITSKTDPLSMAAETFRRTGGKKSWTVTGPEGRNDYEDDPVDAFWEIMGMSGELPSEKRLDWGKELEKIAKEWHSTPKEVAAAIRAIPSSKKHNWRSFTVPKGDSFSGLIGQMIDVVRLGPRQTIPNLDNFNFSGANQGRR